MASDTQRRSGGVCAGKRDVWSGPYCAHMTVAAFAPRFPPEPEGWGPEGKERKEEVWLPPSGRPVLPRGVGPNDLSDRYFRLVQTCGRAGELPFISAPMV